MIDDELNMTAVPNRRSYGRNPSLLGGVINQANAANHDFINHPSLQQVYDTAVANTQNVYVSSGRKNNAPI